MTKAVVFDLGKVLVDFDYAIAIRRIAARGKIPLEELGQVVSQSPLLMEYECGRLTSREFYEQVCAVTGYAGDFEEFGVSFGDIFQPIEPMVELQARLRQKRIPTYIFSNTNELAVLHIRRAFPFFKNFDGYVLSYEHGAMKPDPALYEVVERVSGCRGAELLYVDDRPENIDSGAARGWQVILQETPAKTQAELARRGLLNGA